MDNKGKFVNKMHLASQGHLFLNHILVSMALDLADKDINLM